MCPATPASLIAVVLLALATGGCGSDDPGQAASEVRGSEATGTSASPTDGAQSSRSELRDARTVADQKNQMCSAPNAQPDTESMYDPVVVADGDLTIGEVRALGDGVELVDAEGAVVAGPPGSVGRGMNVAWPWPDDARSLPSIDPGTRTDLVGMTVEDGQTVLPLLRIRHQPDAHLTGLRISYTWGEANRATLVVPMDMTYGRHLEDC